MENKIVNFYLGANSENGFASHFSQLSNPYNGYRSYVIKGGPGTGKSSFMKKIAKNFADKENLLELIHCSSDPDSLDALFLHNAKVTFCDGTPPHVIEPKYPGAFESVVNFLDTFNEDNLEKEKSDIVKYTIMISSYHQKFSKFLRCANILRDENKAIIAPFIDVEKLKRTVNSIIKKEVKPKKNIMGTVKKRLLTAFTPQGIVTYNDTIPTLCKKNYILADRYGCVNDLFMKTIVEKITTLGYDCYACYCPFKPDLELSHVLVPELELGFISQTKLIPISIAPPYKTINFTRFVYSEILAKTKERLSFNEKVSKEILNQGMDCVATAKKLHDDLEKFYIPNVDFTKIDQKYQSIKTKVTKRYL